MKRLPASKAGYPGKYLSKERESCFKGWRLWAAFGDWRPTRVSDLEKRSAFATVYRHFKEKFEWEGNQGFYKRLEFVRQSLDFETRTREAQEGRGKQSELLDKILAEDRVLIL